MSQPSPQYESGMQEAIEHHRATKTRERQLSHELMEHRLWLHSLTSPPDASEDEEPALFADQIKQLTHRDGRTYGGDGS